ncbi:MAG: o-succinylbenzoate synthase, partial [Actinomycetota bacterium]|nr:o-succinylbenzoate synthase [Actinomycetota bacterium]
MTSDSWRLIELDLPLRRPFGTAHGRTFTRRIVFIGVQDGDQTGWGEAAPYPGISRESIDEVWEALTGGEDL